MKEQCLGVAPRGIHAGARQGLACLGQEIPARRKGEGGAGAGAGHDRFGAASPDAARRSACSA